MPCPAEWPGLAKLSWAGWSFSGCTSTSGALLLFSSPWSSLFSAVGWLPDAASIGSHRKPMQLWSNTSPPGLAPPCWPRFLRSAQPTPFNALPKKVFSPGSAGLRNGWLPQRLQTNSFRGMEMMKWTSFPQLNASEVWGYHFVVTLQFDACLSKSDVKGRDRPWYYKISPSQWNIMRHCWSYLHQGSKQIFTGLWLERN